MEREGLAQPKASDYTHLMGGDPDGPPVFTKEFFEAQMEVIIEGARDVLSPGDAIYYDATASHLVRAYGDSPAKILAVLIS